MTRNLHDFWDRIPRKVKIGAGSALAAGGVVAGGFAAFGPAPSQAHYADYASGEFGYDPTNAVVTNSDGQPAILSYLNNNESPVGEQPTLTVSMASRLPALFTNDTPEGRYLDTVQNSARSSWEEAHTRWVETCSGVGEDRFCSSHLETYYVTEYRHYTYPLEIEKDFRRITEYQAEQIMAYFAEFTRVTGIQVDVKWDDPDADITIAQYYNQPDSIRGTLNYVNPNEISSVPPSATGHGFATDNGFIILDQRDYGNGINLDNAVGEVLGMIDKNVDVPALRLALANYRQQVPSIAGGNTRYPLDGNLSPWSDLIPSHVIVDTGGENTLVGSADGDMILTDAGFCGYTDIPETRLGNVFGSGDRYCIAEGEFAVVQAGAGDDFIIAAAGAAQSIQPGPGEDQILFFEPNVGDKIILAEQEPAEGERQIESTNTLVLHRSLIARTEITPTQDGDDILLTFTAASGRITGSIIIDSNAVQRLMIVGDRSQDVLFEADVEGLNAEQWQADAITPATEKVQEYLLEEAKAELENSEEVSWTDRLQVPTLAISTGRG